MKFQFFGVVRSEIQSYIIFEIFGSLGHFWPELWAENDENRAFAQNGAPVRGPKRVQGRRIFNFLGSLDSLLKNLTVLKISALGAVCEPFEGSPNLKVQKRRPPVI